MATVTIGKWGNAVAVRIPQPFCEQMALNAGDSVRMLLDSGNRIVIERLPEEHTLAARMAGWDGGRFETQEYDWGEPVGGEMW